MLAVDVILGQQPGTSKPDVVVTIVDASNLERNLYLTTQIMELGVPVVVVLNMTDVAEAHGVSIDVERLSQQMGVRVVPIQANKGKGLTQLKTAIAEALQHPPPGRAFVFPTPLESEAAGLQLMLGDNVPNFLA